MAGFKNIGKVQGKEGKILGLDLGNYSVKVVEISTASGVQRLASIGHKKIQDRTKEALIDTVGATLKEAKSSAKEANISVSGSSIIVRSITMPKMTEDELKGAIRFEAEKSIPFNIDDCIVDFQILKKIEKENKIEVLLVAAKKAFVEEKISLIEECGLTVKTVDVDGLAIGNCFFTNFPKLPTDKSYALLNIGQTISTLSIAKDGIIFLVRDMPIGSRDFDQRISKALNIDISKAEEARISPKEYKDEVATCIKAVFNNLIDELRLPFSYYENQSGKGLDEIYLSGGPAKTTGLADMFEDAFGSKAVLWDPIQFLDTSDPSLDKNILESMRSSFAVAAGLAVRT